MQKIEFAGPFSKRCKARTTSIKPGENGRCDRKPHDGGPHIADNHAYELHWFDGTYVGKANV